MDELLLTLLFGILLAPVAALCCVMIIIYIYDRFSTPMTREELDKAIKSLKERKNGK